MELNDEIEINAPISTVYAALNDPEILQQCIPGCEELIKHSDTNLEAKVVAGTAEPPQSKDPYQNAQFP